MNLTLKIWRQKNADAKGGIEAFCRTLATELGLCRSAWLAAARLAGDATERFAFPTLFNMLRHFGRKNLQLGPRLGGR